MRHCLLLTEEVDDTADALAAGDVHRRHADLRSSERHLGLYLAGSRHRRGRRRPRRQVVEVEPQRAAARDPGVGHELQVGRLRAVDVKNAGRLVAFGRSVAPCHRTADEHRVAGADEPVEDACAPVDSITMHQARLRVTAAHEPTNHADAVGLPRPANGHRQWIEPEIYCACITAHNNVFTKRRSFVHWPLFVFHFCRALVSMQCMHSAILFLANLLVCAICRYQSIF